MLQLPEQRCGAREEPLLRGHPDESCFSRGFVARLAWLGGRWSLSGSQNPRTKRFPRCGAAGTRVRSAVAAAPAWMEPGVCRGWRLGRAGLVEHETSLPGARRPARHPGESGEVRSSSRGTNLCRESPGPGDGQRAAGISGEGRISVPSPWPQPGGKMTLGLLPAWGLLQTCPCSAPGAAVGFGQGCFVKIRENSGGKFRV